MQNTDIQQRGLHFVWSWSVLVFQVLRQYIVALDSAKRHPLWEGELTTSAVQGEAAGAEHRGRSSWRRAIECNGMSGGDVQGELGKFQNGPNKHMWGDSGFHAAQPQSCLCRANQRAENVEGKGMAGGDVQGDMLKPSPANNPRVSTLSDLLLEIMGVLVSDGLLEHASRA